MIRIKGFFVFILLLLSFRGSGQELYTIPVNNPLELREFLRYSGGRQPLVSAHRGGAREGFPENCIETFENTLKHIPAILEVDPRYTKDSVIVLMHDATLERTTNGQGKVADHTLEELKKLRLKDTEGRLTPYRIPTLDEALEWVKGKTVLILDRKDVPLEARIKKIEEHQAEASAMIMAYTYEEAARCYRLNPDIMMEVFIPDTGKAAEFGQTGVPWQNIVAFITHDRPALQHAAVAGLLHEKGALCIVGSSRTIDRDYLEGEITGEAELNAQYKNLLENGADIIEADLAIEAGRAVDANGQGFRLGKDTLGHSLPKADRQRAPEKSVNLLKEKLERIRIEDQMLRFLLPAAEEKFGKDSEELDYYWSLILQQDSLNVLAVTKIIDKHGWAGKSEVGDLANQAVWLVIQHAPLETQEKYLPLLEESVKNGESEGWHLAFLEDRVLMRKGEKQKYGTQAKFNETTGKNHIHPIENPEAVNKLRAEIGLEPIEEYAGKNGYVYD